MINGTIVYQTGEYVIAEWDAFYYLWKLPDSYLGIFRSFKEALEKISCSDSSN